MLKIEEAGRHLVAGFDGTDVNDHLKTLINEFGVGGIILFTRNFESPDQIYSLTIKIRELAKQRILIGVDQEGGRVQRFGAPFTDWPTMRQLGATGDEILAENFGHALAAEVAAVGCDWVFAPVMDVDSNPDNPVIGDRSFGRDVELVSKMGAAVIRGIQGLKIISCAKHYPGHGDTSTDSHKTLPVVMENEEVLFQREIPAFEAAINANVASIMTAHVIYPAVDLAHPATCSRVHIAGRLRKAFMYDGIVITDDLEMAAVCDRYEPADLYMMSFYAGNDFLLACHTIEVQEDIVRTFYDARLANLLPAEGFFQSEKRIERLHVQYPKPATGNVSIIGCEKHRKLAEEIRSRSI